MCSRRTIESINNIRFRNRTACPAALAHVEESNRAGLLSPPLLSNNRTGINPTNQTSLDREAQQRHQQRCEHSREQKDKGGRHHFILQDGFVKKEEGEANGAGGGGEQLLGTRISGKQASRPWPCFTIGGRFSFQRPRKLLAGGGGVAG